ncbi:peptidylprolyl isomerase [Xanthobacter versatilis]|uniref:peptidylprolyl isomerase n=1 Tax=Xanthobacter autotrophicus (strain ATCC BAA-1158 / Py2) TaxID=78245 RepID=UPI0037290325
MAVQKRLAAALLLLLALAALFAGGTVRAQDTVATAGGVTVSVAEVEAVLATLPEAERTALAADPAALARIVRTYMAERLLLKAGRDEGFEARPDISAKLARARDALLMDLFLQSKDGPAATAPSDTDVRALYEASKTKLVAPARYRLAQIFIAAPAGQTSSPKLDEVTAKLKARGATSETGFAALAKAYTDSKTEAARGGEIGWLAEPSIAPEIRAALKDLKPGGVTAPVRLANGWHIVRLMEVQPAGTTAVPYDTVKDQLAAQLKRQRIDAARQDYVSGLIGKDGIAIDDAALTALAARVK